MLKSKYEIDEPLSKSMNQFSADLYYNALVSESKR